MRAEQIEEKIAEFELAKEQLPDKNLRPEVHRALERSYDEMIVQLKMIMAMRSVNTLRR